MKCSLPYGAYGRMRVSVSMIGECRGPPAEYCSCEGRHGSMLTLLAHATSPPGRARVRRPVAHARGRGAPRACGGYFGAGTSGWPPGRNLSPSPLRGSNPRPLPIRVCPCECRPAPISEVFHVAERHFFKRETTVRDPPQASMVVLACIDTDNGYSGVGPATRSRGEASQ
jgi:hypothetical protein